MDQACDAPRVRQLIRRAASPELRADGYPVSVDHVFAVWTGDDAAPLYPVRVTVETAAAEGSGGPVLTALAQEAARHLRAAFDICAKDMPLND